MNASRNRRPAPAARRGVALVAALGLLILGAALLVGSAVASFEMRRGARSRTAWARAESEMRRGVGVMVQEWTPSLDSLPIGRRVERAVTSRGAPDPDVALQGAVRRLTARLFAASVTVTVGREGDVRARRRAVLFLERPVVPESGAAAARVTPLRGWTMLDLR